MRTAVQRQQRGAGGGALQLLHASVEEAIAAGERPGTEEVLVRLLRTIDELDARERIARVAVHVWGEALVNPAVGSAFTAAIARLQTAMERLVATAQAAGQLDRDLDPVYVARVLYSILPGFLLQRALDPALDGAGYQRATRALIAGRLRLS